MNDTPSPHGAGIPDRLAAALADRYVLDSPLGAGGMATVYLARDLKHDRQVAIKVLRPELAAVIGGERFVSEIKTTAALQHPNILPLFDSGEADSFLYYVMPYVEGESLRDRLDREGQLPVEESIRIARAVGGALQYAHERGIIHRDIKPANILLQAGQPVVADFGIALAISAAGGGRLTETGMSVGTPHYMSPEQASADRDLDPRSDTYALGCVLYEMLAGDPPHTGPSAQAVLMRILTESPRPVTDVRRSVPPHVRDALAKCLEKLPADRFPDARSFVEALEDPGFQYHPTITDATVQMLPARRLETSRRGTPGWMIPAALAGGLAAGAFIMGLVPDPAPELAPPTRMDLSLGEVVLEPPEIIHVSPDGRRFAAVGDIDPDDGIFVRTSSETEFRRLEGTNAATFMAFSPDGQSIAFVDEDGAIHEIGADGGPIRTLWPGDDRPQPPLFLHWDPSGSLLFSRFRGQGSGRTEMLRLPAEGGQPEALFGTQGGIIYSVHILPGGRHVLFTTANGRALEVHDLEADSSWVLVPSATWSQLLPTGELVYTDAAGGVWGGPFDTDAVAFEREPIPLMDGVAFESLGLTPLISLSRNGTLAYQEGAGQGIRPTSQQLLEIISFDGTVEEVGIRDRRYRNVRWSPDGRSLAFAALEPGQVGGRTSIYTYSVALQTATQRLTDDLTQSFPVWSPDGSRIAFVQAEQTAGPNNAALGAILFGDLYTVNADGTGLTLLAGPEGQDVPYDWGEAGVIFTGGENTGSSELLLADPAGEGSVTTYLDIDGDLGSVTLSPDGRWAAFLSSEGVGVAERIVVRSFPEPGPPIVVSEDGGDRPRWSADGSRIFFWKSGTGQNAPDSLFAARVRTEPGFQLLGTDFVYAVDSRYAISTWDLHPDGDRMVIARLATGPSFEDGPVPAARYLTVVNWFSEVRQALSGPGND